MHASCLHTQSKAGRSGHPATVPECPLVHLIIDERLSEALTTHGATGTRLDKLGLRTPDVEERRCVHVSACCHSIPVVHNGRSGQYCSSGHLRACSSHMRSISLRRRMFSLISWINSSSSCLLVRITYSNPSCRTQRPKGPKARPRLRKRRATRARELGASLLPLDHVIHDAAHGAKHLDELLHVLALAGHLQCEHFDSVHE